MYSTTMYSKIGTSVPWPRVSPFSRHALFLIVFLLVTLCLYGLVQLPVSSRIVESAKVGADAFRHAHAGQKLATFETMCGQTYNPVIADARIWKAAMSRTEKLLDDKFTMVMTTYRRPQFLKDTLEHLLGESIPSLHEVVIVWNDVEDEPPADFVSEHGVPVRYRKSKVNSLNQKLIPDPEYETQAVLLSDDDIYYYPEDLEFVFQSWRQLGPCRLAGLTPRTALLKEDGSLAYSSSPETRFGEPYNLILTNLAFAHVAFLDYYSSDDPKMTSIRDYVDLHFNCEDIAMNFVMSMLTSMGPLAVQGHQKAHDPKPKVGISMSPGHWKARTQCLNDFRDIMGENTLVEEIASIRYGPRRAKDWPERVEEPQPPPPEAEPAAEAEPDTGFQTEAEAQIEAEQ